MNHASRTDSPGADRPDLAHPLHAGRSQGPARGRPAAQPQPGAAVPVPRRARSRADLARATGLTRVTISDLVADLLDDGLVEELGRRAGRASASRPRCSASSPTPRTS